MWVDLEEAGFSEANLTRTIISANLTGADFANANLEEAFLFGSNLKGAKNLTIDQLSKVKTLYNAKLDEDLRKQLEEKYPDKYQALIKNPNEQ